MLTYRSGRREGSGSEPVRVAQLYAKPHNGGPGAGEKDEAPGDGLDPPVPRGSGPHRLRHPPHPAGYISAGPPPGPDTSPERARPLSHLPAPRGDLTGEGGGSPVLSPAAGPERRQAAGA